MNVASNLMMVTENAGKSADDVWTKFETFYAKIRDKMVTDEKFETIIGGGEASTGGAD